MSFPAPARLLALVLNTARSVLKEIKASLKNSTGKIKPDTAINILEATHWVYFSLALC